MRVEKRDPVGEAHPDGVAIMDRVIRTRMPEINSLIEQGGLRELCVASGGVQRVLFQMLHAVAGKSRSASTLPVHHAIVASAIESVREDYLAITVEAAPWLSRIQETRTLDGLPASALASLGSYFQAMVVLQFSNGTKWYAIHPLMRERVMRAQKS